MLFRSILYPKLLAEQFDAEGTASISVTFAGKHLEIIYENNNGKDFGSYTAASAVCDETELTIAEDSYAVLPRQMLQTLSDETHRVTITLI